MGPHTISPGRASCSSLRDLELRSVPGRSRRQNTSGLPLIRKLQPQTSVLLQQPLHQGIGINKHRIGINKHSSRDQQENQTEINKHQNSERLQITASAACEHSQPGLSLSLSLSKRGKTEDRKEGREEGRKEERRKEGRNVYHIRMHA